MGIMLVKQISSAIKTVIRNTAPLIRVDDNEINQEVAVGMFGNLRMATDVAGNAVKRYRC
jgi:hypothetical protein